MHHASPPAQLNDTHPVRLHLHGWQTAILNCACPTPTPVQPTPLAGALYSYVGSTVVDGFGTCLMVSVLFAGISTVVDLFLHEEPSATGETPPPPPPHPPHTHLLTAAFNFLLVISCCLCGPHGLGVRIAAVCPLHVCLVVCPVVCPLAALVL